MPSGRPRKPPVAHGGSRRKSDVAPEEKIGNPEEGRVVGGAGVALRARQNKADAQAGAEDGPSA